MERRNFKRHATGLKISIMARGGRMTGRMDNLSVTGCRIECRQGWLDKGDVVRLLLPGDLEVEGEIAWMVQHRFGVKFAGTLQPAIVRKLGFE